MTVVRIHGACSAGRDVQKEGWFLLESAFQSASVGPPENWNRCVKATKHPTSQICLLLQDSNTFKDLLLKRKYNEERVEKHVLLFFVCS